MAVNFPNSPSNGDTYTSSGNTYTYNSTKGVWTSAKTGHAFNETTVSDTAPSNPSNGDQWFSSLTGELFVYYNDGSSSQWVGVSGPAGAAGADGAAGASGGAGTATVVSDMAALIAISGMSAGDQALVTALNKLFMYTGSGWFLIATMTNASPTAITGVNASYGLASDGTATTITAVSTDPEGFPLTWSSAVTSGSLNGTTISNVDNVFTITPHASNPTTFSVTFSVTDGSSGATSATAGFTLQFSVANSRYTSLLVSANAVGNNDGFTDSSSNNYTLTPTGEPIQGTSSPYRKGGYSHYFTGSGTNFAAPSTTALGTGDYTVEGWVNFEDVTTNRTILTIANTHGLFYRNGHQCMAIGGNNFTTGVPSVNTWYHFALVRSSGDVTLYWDGQSKGTVTLNTDYTSSQLTIGAWHTPSEFFKGYLRDIKVSSTAVYSSNFSVPTEKSVSDSNTVLLTCHLPYITDGSSNNYSFTSLSNAPLAYPLGPYDYAEATVTDGGSIEFDGSNDYIYTQYNLGDFDFGTGQFTISFWFYATQQTNNQGAGIISGQNHGGFNIQYDNEYGGISNGIYMYLAGLSEPAIQTGSLSVNQWHYISVQRESTTSLKIYVDGIQAGALTLSASYVMKLSGTDVRIGRGFDINGSGAYFRGTVSDLRIVKGSNSGFAVPTEPLTAVANTKLLVKGEGAKIFDKAQTGNIRLNNNAVGSTTQVKFAGSKSIDLTQNDAHISLPDPFGFGLGTAFTMEGWIYLTQWNGYETMFHETGTSAYLAITGSGGGFEIYNPGVSQPIFSSCGFVLNTWFHWALCRDAAGAWYLFRDGNRITTGNSAINQNDLTRFADAGTEFKIGSKNNNSTQDLSGYIQEFRITDGLARYTSNFTPPTEPLKG